MRQLESKTRVGGGGGSTIKASLASISFVKLPRRLSCSVLFRDVNPTSVFPGARAVSRKGSLKRRSPASAVSRIQHCVCKINKSKIDSTGHSVLLRRRGISAILRESPCGISTADPQLRFVLLSFFSFQRESQRDTATLRLAFRTVESAIQSTKHCRQHYLINGSMYID